MNKVWALLVGYLVGAWPTFGYTSTLLGERIPGSPNSHAEWDVATSVLVAVWWPIYWFCESAARVFGG